MKLKAIGAVEIKAIGVKLTPDSTNQEIKTALEIAKAYDANPENKGSKMHETLLNYIDTSKDGKASSIEKA